MVIRHDQYVGRGGDKSQERDVEGKQWMGFFEEEKQRLMNWITMNSFEQTFHINRAEVCFLPSNVSHLGLLCDVVFLVLALLRKILTPSRNTNLPVIAFQLVPTCERRRLRVEVNHSL